MKSTDKRWWRRSDASEGKTPASYNPKLSLLRSLLIAGGLLCGAASTAFAQTPRTITYNLTTSQRVSLNIYNSSGQIVRELLHGAARTSGSKTEQWDGRDDAGNPLPTGSYTWKMLAAPGFGAEYITSPGTNYKSNESGSFTQIAPGSHGGPSTVAVNGLHQSVIPDTVRIIFAGENASSFNIVSVDSSGFFVGVTFENIDVTLVNAATLLLQGYC